MQFYHPAVWQIAEYLKLKQEELSRLCIKIYILLPSVEYPDI